MELTIGIMGLVAGILVWLFPPEPLRRFLKICHVSDKGVNQTERTSEIPRIICQKVEGFLKSHPERTDSDNKLRVWIRSLDDELLLLAIAMTHFEGRGVTTSWISDHSHPLGRGRSVPELIEALFAAGILAPSTEELLPNTYAELDAKRNPSYDFGRMLREARGRLKQAEAKGRLIASGETSAANT